jgi:DNA-binding transcriptional MerR regulator
MGASFASLDARHVPAFMSDLEDRGRRMALDLDAWGKVYPRLMADLLIGEVAARSGLSRKALRLYERRGILPRAHRTASGYRVYPADVLGMLRFVSQARQLGLTLAQIGQITAQRRTGTEPCAHVRALLEEKAADLADTLGAVRAILRSWPKNEGRHAAICPHIEAKGGARLWRKSSGRSARTARTVRRSSSTTRPFASARTRTPQS